ncbi:hypothetical protein GmHk_17G049183 [Glycine max]|nr:hypothetical protein GmHk_17G049183 [Glycine max]
MELLEVPTVGRQYTWFRPNGESKSRLDRALISPEWRDTWPESVQFTLSRNFSDHCPILLKANNMDWGPKPFRILNCWLTDKSFREVVNQCWNFVQVSRWGPYVLKEKIKRLKCKLKIWNKEEYGDSFKKVQQLEVELNKLEEDTLHRQMTDLEISRRKKLQEDLWVAAQAHEALLRQKSRSRWLKEGDCNTTFFYIRVNANRNRNCIKKLLIEGRVGHQSMWWKDLKQTVNSAQLGDIVHSKMRWKIVRGDKVRLWEDKWNHQQQPLVERYPRLYQISTQQNQTIRQMGQHLQSGWEWQLLWRRPLFENEIESAINFLKDIEGIHIQQQGSDEWEWLGDQTRNYSTRSAYNLVLEASTGGQQEE